MLYFISYPKFRRNTHTSLFLNRYITYYKTGYSSRLVTGGRESANQLVVRAQFDRRSVLELLLRECGSERGPLLGGCYADRGRHPCLAWARLGSWGLGSSWWDRPQRPSQMLEASQEVPSRAILVVGARLACRSTRRQPGLADRSPWVSCPAGTPSTRS